MCLAKKEVTKLTPSARNSKDGPEGIIYHYLFAVHGTIKRRLLIYRAKYKNKFFSENRCNWCNRVTRAVNALLYIGIFSYISEKQKSNRT